MAGVAEICKPFLANGFKDCIFCRGGATMVVLVGGQLALVGVLGVQELVLGGSGRHCWFTTGMIGFHKRCVGPKCTLGKGHHVGIPNSNGEGQALGVGGGGLVTKAFHNL